MRGIPMYYDLTQLEFKYIRIFSDIHLDFDYYGMKGKNISFDKIWRPTKLSTDKETILILAGDLWNSHKIFSFMGKSWLKGISQRYGLVLVVLGNHDFWNGNLPLEYDYFLEKKYTQHLDNVYLLQNSIVELKNAIFLGNTLWTDFGNDPEVMNMAEKNIKDYQYIRHGNAFSKLNAKKLMLENEESVKFINENRYKNENQVDKKLWVVTHHAPSISRYLNSEKALKNLSSDSEYDRLMPYIYYNQLDDLIIDSNIDCWVHGHVHEQQYYKIGNTKIIANPRGYKFQKIGFQEDLLFDIKGRIVKLEIV